MNYPVKQNSSVNKVIIGWTTGVLFPAGTRFFQHQKQTSSYPMSIKALSLGANKSKHEAALPSGAKFVIAWSFTSTFPIHLMI
jgi:hypothetical protein